MLTDTVDFHPNKEGTFVHSHDQLFPHFDERIHDTNTVSLQLTPLVANMDRLHAPVVNHIREANLEASPSPRMDLISPTISPDSPYNTVHR